MLQAIKDKTRGWIAYVIIAMLAIPFAFFGLYSYFQPDPNQPVAEVEGEEIGSRELQQAVSQQRQRIKRQQGEDFDPDQIDQQRLRREVLSQLIDQRVLRHFADSNRMVAPDSVVRERVRNNERFQVGGEFSEERYRQFLQQNNLRASDYENRLRSSATVGVLRNAIQSSALVTPTALKRMAALEYQRRHVAWLRIDAQTLSDEIDITDDQIASYYEDNKGAFERPERVQLAYVELDPDAVGKDIEVSSEELRQEYRAIKDQRGSPERRRVEQIQLDVPEDADDEAVEEAKERLASIRDRIRSGDLSFEEAAREYSEDDLTAKQGGELGMVSPGDLGGPFEDKLFELEEGRISQPVRTGSAVHLIRVTEIKPADRPSFEEVRDDLRQSLREEKAKRRVAERLSDFKNLAYKNRNSLKPVASELGLDIQKTDWVTARGGDGIASEDEVIQAAFSSPVLEERRNSEALELGANRHVVIRVREHQPAQAKPLDKVRDQVKARLRAEKLVELVAERGDELIQQVEEDDVRFGSLADREGVSLNEYGWITRRNREEVPRAILQQAFTMKSPEGDELSLEGTRLTPEKPGQAPDYAVIAVRDVEDGSLEGLPDEQREQLRQRLLLVSQRGSLDEFVAVLRDNADVTIHEKQLRSGGQRDGGGSR